MLGENRVSESDEDNIRKKPENLKIHREKNVENTQQANMLRVAHRHSVFTIPDTLRNYFYSRRDLLKELQDGVYDVNKLLV